jgi:hypothetical protein
LLCVAVSLLCEFLPGFRGLSDWCSHRRRQMAVGAGGIGSPVSVCERCGSVWSRGSAVSPRSEGSNH